MPIMTQSKAVFFPSFLQSLTPVIGEEAWIGLVNSPSLPSHISLHSSGGVLDVSQAALYSSKVDFPAPPRTIVPHP